MPLANTVLHTAALLSVAHFRELVTASLMLRPLTQPAALDLYVPVWMAVVSVAAQVLAPLSDELPAMDSGICVSQTACRFVLSPS